MSPKEGERSITEEMNEKLRMRSDVMHFALTQYKHNSELYQNAEIVGSNSEVMERAFNGVAVKLFFESSKDGVRYHAISFDNGGNTVSLFSSEDQAEALGFVREEREKQMEIIKRALHDPYYEVIARLTPKSSVVSNMGPMAG